MGGDFTIIFSHLAGHTAIANAIENGQMAQTESLTFLSVLDAILENEHTTAFKSLLLCTQAYEKALAFGNNREESQKLAQAIAWMIREEGKKLDALLARAGTDWKPTKLFLENMPPILTSPTQHVFAPSNDAFIAASHILHRNELQAKGGIESPVFETAFSNDDIRKLRTTIYTRFGALQLRGTGTRMGFSHSREPKEHRILHTYHIDPSAPKMERDWLDMLRASFLAALDRSYQHTGLSVRYHLDKSDNGWKTVIVVYCDESTYLGRYAVQFHPCEHRPYRKALEVVWDGPVLKRTFRENSIPTHAKLLLRFVPQREEIKEAEQKARAHLKKQGLVSLREEYLSVLDRKERLRLEEQEAERRKKREEIGPNEETLPRKEINPEYRRLWDLEENLRATLFRSVGYDRPQKSMASETSGVLGNFDLYLVHHFLKEILWQRFLKKFQAFLQS